MNEVLRVILEKILEAIFFSIFMIKGKNIKEKRILFTLLMIFQYLALKSFIKYNILFQVAYTFITYFDLKILYKNKAQITDIFLFTSASILLMVSSLICVGIRLATHIGYFETLIINRIMMFCILFLIRNKINSVYQKYYKRWNKHKDKTKIRSLTLRNISVIVFNLMFYIMNIGLTYIILTK